MKNVLIIVLRIIILDLLVYHCFSVKFASALEELAKSEEVPKKRKRRVDRMARKLKKSLEPDFTILYKTENYLNVRKMEKKAIKVSFHIFAICIF